MLCRAVHEDYTTTSLLHNILDCLLYLFWACVVSPGHWIWPWFCPLACPISWLCHCGDTINLLFCHNVGTFPFPALWKHCCSCHPASLPAAFAVLWPRVRPAESCWKYLTAYIFCLLAFLIFLILSWALASAWLFALCLQGSSSVPSLVFPGISQKKTQTSLKWLLWFSLRPLS